MFILNGSGFRQGKQACKLLTLFTVIYSIRPLSVLYLTKFNQKPMVNYEVAEHPLCLSCISTLMIRQGLFSRINT